MRILQVEGMVEEAANKVNHDLRGEESPEAKRDGSLTARTRIIDSTDADDESE